MASLAYAEGLWRGGRWPMTRGAWQALQDEIASATDAVVAGNGYTTGHLDGEPDAPAFVPNVVGQQLFGRLSALRAALAEAVIVDDARLAVIGRRVTLRDDDGHEDTYELVSPGAGDPRAGLVAADSPVGSAILGARLGEVVQVAAPAGTWSATVTRID